MSVDAQPPSAKEGRELNRASFDLMLARLADDREGAGLEYERLRIRLIRFFTMHRAPQPETLADEAFNRLARRLAEGEAVRNPVGYLSGIARLLVQEDRTRQVREAQAMKSAPEASPNPAEETELRLALENCLDELSGAERELLYQYYGGKGAGHIALRERLAANQGINLNALRNRMLRLRLRLQRCVEGHTSGKTGRDVSPGSDTNE
jgi:DNA-directed RNA polymerase specialized sigma24 family protein